MSERLEREIEEILRRMDSSGSRRPSPKRSRRLLRRLGAEFRYVFSGFGFKITPTKVMVLSLVLFGLTFFLRVGLRQLSLYVGLLATILFFAAIIMSARGGRGIRYERRWRGQLIELPSENPLNNLRAWWLRQQRRIRRWFS